MKIILDSGHGVDTPGKRSPIYAGYQFFEWEFNRDIVNRICRILYHISDVSPIIVNSTIYDMSLPDRVNYINSIAGDKMLISIHANAGGGKGFEVFTSVGETKSDEYATIMMQEFEREYSGMKTRNDLSDGDPDKESQFYILKNTNCPAILTENFFMDQYDDYQLLTSYEHRERIARYHVATILRIVNS